MKPLLDVQNVSYTYHTLSGETKALERLSFQVHFNEFVGIIGPSGCGKSTILSLIFGLIPPESGTIQIHEDLKKNHIMPIGYMLQKDHLLEWRTIYENTLLGLEINHVLDAKHLTAVDQMFKDYGLEQFKHSKPSQLSGGMRQRAALIRTLALDPGLLLLDEPFSALDSQTRIHVSEDIYSILRKKQKSAILVTHDISEAISFCDRIIVLTHRPGTVQEIVPVELSLDDKTPLKARSAKEFQYYFNHLWGDLNEASNE